MLVIGANLPDLVEVVLQVPGRVDLQGRRRERRAKKTRERATQEWGGGVRTEPGSGTVTVGTSVKALMKSSSSIAPALSLETGHRQTNNE